MNEPKQPTMHEEPKSVRSKLVADFPSGILLSVKLDVAEPTLQPELDPPDPRRGD